MHEFEYKKEKLRCEGIAVAELAKKFGTPLYVYSHKTLVDHYDKIRKAFAPLKPLICYSVKANSNLTILKTLVSRGAGLDIVSGGELFRALKAGCPPEKIVYASVGKTQAEIETAIKKGILFFNAESRPELESINLVAGRLKKKVAVAVRINPDVEPKTHAFITTGKLTNKFGIDFHAAGEIFANAAELPWLLIKGIHIHIGSQITEAEPFEAALKKVITFVSHIRQWGIKLEYLNIGGGMGIIYNEERPQSASDYAGKIIPLLKDTGLKIIMEPGRFIVGQAGVLLTRVLYVKKTPLKNFIIVDAGMNDLIRPAIYGAYHQILPAVAREDSPEDIFDVVGPICESGDFLAKERRMKVPSQGDILAVMTAGAYGLSMSSNYNSRMRAAEIMVKGAKASLIRERETYADLIDREKLIKL